MSGPAGVSKSYYDSAEWHGTQNAHNPLDKKDSQTHPNTANQVSLEHKLQEEAEEELKNKNPTDLAKEHGNKPSRGAEIDEELKKDDQLRLKEKSGK